MKGIEVTTEQLESARRFLDIAGTAPWDKSKEHENCHVNRGKLVRMLAWYGAIRAKAANEIPGEIVELKP